MVSTIIARGAEALLLQKGATVVKQRIPKSYRLPLLDEKLRRQRTRREARLLQKASALIPVPAMLASSTYDITLEHIQGRKLSEHLDTLNQASDICEQMGKNIATLHDANIIHGDLTTSNMITIDVKELDTNRALQGGGCSLSIQTSRISNPRWQSRTHVLDETSATPNHTSQKPSVFDDRREQQFSRFQGVVAHRFFDNKNSRDNKNILIDKTSNNKASKHRYERARGVYGRTAMKPLFFIDFGLSFESSRVEDKAVDLHVLKEAFTARHYQHVDEFWNAVLAGYATSKHAAVVLKRLKNVESRGRYKQAY